MKRSFALILVMISIIFLLSGCKEQNIINSTPSSEPSADLSNLTAESAEDQTENQGVSIDEVIINISNPSNNGEGTEENGSANITDVITDEETQDMTGYWGKLTVSFIDVGFGDSIFVFTPRNGTMMIDGGDDSSGSIITKYIRNYGIYNGMDTMIATNPKLEHIGGLDSILFNMVQVSEVYDNGVGSDSQSYNQFKEMANNKGMFIVPEEDVFVKVGNEEAVKVRLITPYKDGYLDRTEDNSIVVKMEYGDVSFLFMSDCTKECEKKLEGYDLKADILKVGNFGMNSTSDDFLDNVDPEVAIISVDADNPQYPDNELVQRLEGRGIQVLRTDLYGTITVGSDGKTYAITKEREPDNSSIEG